VARLRRGKVTRAASAGRASRVAIALGSNLGDRTAHLDYAVGRLQRLLINPRVSDYLETEPVAVVGEQRAFLNAAVAGGFEGTARALMAALLAIELERGRVRPHRGAARTLDLDLVLFDDLVVSEADLVVPHPRFRERLFVLEPLAQVAGEWVDPVTGQTVRELLELLAVKSR
jgi:2-amino-4-hydroxy-6-hydroxymethyldihydropteridine diphosphokinase